jgi:hypothetical protein
MTINYDKTNLRNKFEGNFSFWMFVLIWVKLQCYKKIKPKEMKNISLFMCENENADFIQ